MIMHYRICITFAIWLCVLSLAHQLISEMDMNLLHPIINAYQCKECDESFKQKEIFKIHLKIHSWCVLVKSFAFSFPVSLMYFGFVYWAMSLLISFILSFIVTINDGYKYRKHNQICSSKYESTSVLCVLYLSLGGTVIILRELVLHYAISECIWWLMLWITFDIGTYGSAHKQYVWLPTIVAILDAYDSFSTYCKIFQNTINK